MNSLYNSALRQGTSIRKDLDALASQSSVALIGQINASLTSFNRTIDDYSKLAKQEPVPEKQTKAQERIKNFRAELADYRERFERLKRENEERERDSVGATLATSDLNVRRPHMTATPDNPYGGSPYGAQTAPVNRYAMGGYAAPPPGDAMREDHAFRETTFLQQASTQMDEFLERGADVLGNLGQQRDMLKNTQRKLYSVGNTLGISGDTIRMVERRAKQDKWIFWGGVIIFFVFCYLVLKWLR